MKTYIGISRDHSVSMSSIASAAKDDYNATIASIREANTREKQETMVTVLRSGVGYSGDIEQEILNESVVDVAPINSYPTTGGSTPLFDSVGRLIEIFEREASAPKLTFNGKSVAGAEQYTASEVMDLVNRLGKTKAADEIGVHKDTIRKWVKKIEAAGGADDHTAYLIMAITDGQDNASRRWPAAKLAAKMRELIATDRWTFVFRVPRGYKRALVALGIPEGNILEWDLTTKGVKEATATTSDAFKKFYAFRSSGGRGTKTFYTDMSTASKKDVSGALTDITKKVDVNEVDKTMTVAEFSKEVLGRPLVKGTLFYQLMKRENAVQDYKQICIREKKTGKVYGGADARTILGLPEYGTVPVTPGDHGLWDIFIQSTSATRKLPSGTLVVYWKDAAK